MTPAEALSAVAASRGVSVEALRGAGRGRYVCAARAAAALELHQLGLSTQEVGAVLGGRHHSTVIYLIRTAKRVAEGSVGLPRGAREGVV